MKRWAAALLLLLAASGACAEEEARLAEWAEVYGGRGRDVIVEAVQADGGFFAVGQTTSTDGTLDMRRRRGETGWALRVGEDGQVLWNYCTAHVGRSRMNAPFVHQNGVLSCTLSGRDSGQEWLWLNDRGELLARIEVPGTDEFCDRGGFVQGFPFDRDGKPMLALFTRHEDGTFCCAAMNEYGMVSPGAAFDVPALMKVCEDGTGGLAAAGVEDGRIVLCRMLPGSMEQAESVRLSPMEDRVLDVCDMIPAGDGSMILCGDTEAGGYLLRVNAQGDRLFERETEQPVWQLAATPTGFAALQEDCILYFDEDGGLLGESPLHPDAEAVDLVGLQDGAVLIENPETDSVSVRAVAMQKRESEPVSEENLLFVAPDSRLLAAETLDGGIALLCVQEDGQMHQVIIDATQTVYAMDRTLNIGLTNEFSLPDGLIGCEKVDGGAQVTCWDAQGSPLWQTGMHIHTAADELQWLCAAPAKDGGVLLGGRYLTDTPDGGRQSGVLARLSEDGILLGMLEVQGAGCVSAILPDEDGIHLLIAEGTRQEDPVLYAALLEERRAVSISRLDRPMEAEGAHLLSMGGVLYAAGNALSDGHAQAVLQRVP